MFRKPYIWQAPTLSALHNHWLDIRFGVRNLWRWLPVIWFDDDCDWSYLARLMEYKLRFMSDGFRRCGNTVNSDRHARQMALCAALLKRLADDDYVFTHKRPFGSERERSKHTLDSSSRDQRYVGLIIGKHMNCWWD